MKNSILICLSLSLCLFQACIKENCDGADQITSFAHLTLQGPEEVRLNLNDSEAFISLSMNQEVTTRKGTRSCRQKDLALQDEDRWDTSSFRLTCAQEVSIKGTILPANTNLLQGHIYQNNINLDSRGFLHAQSGVTLILDKPNSNISYAFNLKGKTTEGKTLNAQDTVNIIP